MAQTVVYASQSTYLDRYNIDTTYAAARDAASANLFANGVEFEIGQDYLSGKFNVFRGGLFFAIPSTFISAVTLSLYGLKDWSTTDFNITVIDGSVIEDTPVAGDFGDLKAVTTSWGTVNTSGFTIAGYNDITLNSTGLAAVVAAAGGTLKVAFRSDREIAGTTPKLNGADNEESVQIHGVDAATAYKPKLTITYGGDEEHFVIKIVQEDFHWVGASGTEYLIKGFPVP